MRLGIAEIFAKVEEAKTQEEKIAVLQAHGPAKNNTGLSTFLRWMMEKETPWHPDLPEEKVKFVPSPYFDQQIMLYQKIKMIPRHFWEGGTEMPAEKRTNLWIQLLEGLDKDDARLLEAVRRRSTLPYKTITRKLIREAFPGFLEESDD